MAGCSVRTTCPYCGVGCGVLATRMDHGSVTIAGDPEHPANFGRLCSKGAALAETLSLDDRLLHPMIDGARASWDEALSRVADRFGEVIDRHGPEAVAFYVSGQLLTEDYYVANKLMKGYIGAANIDTNSRLCMASSVAGHKRAFGSDTVPGSYEDLEQADLVVLIGSNLAWCHPVLYQRLAAAREVRGTKVVVIDPRATATCEIADLHLPIAPGTDVALLNGLLVYLAETGAIDSEFVDRHTSGADVALKAATALGRDQIAGITGLPGSQIQAFYEMFAGTERVVTVYSQGVNQSSAGTDKVNAILNCHLATGRIGWPGMGPFSVTGQPNAMGGREVGGLANMLAAHMELADPAHRCIVQKFWGSPRIADAPGLKAVDMFRAVGDGRIKAIWIMATNPVDSLPDADSVRDAIARCPFVVVSDVTRQTDTAELAHVLLPATAWGEKEGTVTNSERRISRQRAFLTPPGEARADWWQLAEVARRMGFSAGFGWRGPAQIFAEHAALTGVENRGSRDLDISVHAEIDDAAYDPLEPFQWPTTSAEASPSPPPIRFFGDGRFFTPDRRARLVPTPFRAPEGHLSGRYPLILNTGRIRDQWHTMTRTGKSPRLMTHRTEPFIEVSPDDARGLGLRDGELAHVESASGAAIGRVRLVDSQRAGSAFMPIHWTDQMSRRARVDALVAAVTDPISGQPQSKYTPISIRPAVMAWHGFAVVTERSSLAHLDYFAVAPVKGGFLLELAHSVEPKDWEQLARAILPAPATGSTLDVLAYHDTAAGHHRMAVFEGDQLVGALFVGREPSTLSRSWVVTQLGKVLSAAERLRMLAGRPSAAVKDKGPIVCACLEVGRAEIVDAIVAQGCASVADVGHAVKAGTQCGSCRAEIGRLIDDVRFQKAG